MPLESLLRLVETLRARIEAHGADLRGSEALTRYALIDPLLRELGWDTADPSLVMPEYTSGAGRVDYALLADGSPAVMVEAKKLGTSLKGAVNQVISYCMIEGTDYFALTDGERWEVYETHKQGRLDEKRVVEFDLMNQSPAETCLKALALWRQAVEANVVSGGQEPLVSQPKKAPAPTTVAQPTTMSIPRNPYAHTLRRMAAAVEICRSAYNVASD